jgi:hypothetical protein
LLDVVADQAQRDGTPPGVEDYSSAWQLKTGDKVLSSERHRLFEEVRQRANQSLHTHKEVFLNARKNLAANSELVPSIMGTLVELLVKKPARKLFKLIKQTGASFFVVAIDECVILDGIVARGPGESPGPSLVSLQRSLKALDDDFSWLVFVLLDTNSTVFDLFPVTTDGKKPKSFRLGGTMKPLPVYNNTPFDVFVPLLYVPAPQPYTAGDAMRISQLAHFGRPVSV